MKPKFTFLMMAMLILISSTAALYAQDEIFMYGKIYTVDDKTYEGPIRWGKEEVYWIDVFNASKYENKNLKYLSRADREYLDSKNRDWERRVSNWFGEWVRYTSHTSTDYTHQFACQFGEIKSLRPTGRQRVEVIMQNGLKYDLNGEGYNDIGGSIKIADKEIGTIDLQWNRIDKIEFRSTPSSLPNKFGKPLYGTVETYSGKFTGLIQWDHDERVSTDKLDGSSDDGKLSIEFGKIKSIERGGNRSNVTLYSGRTIKLWGSNDVNNENRGIIVTTDDNMIIDIPWKEFEKVTFLEKAPKQSFSYDRFNSQKELKGTLTTTDGKTLSGSLIYDLDEQFDHELLQGKFGDIEYAIPFKSIKSITPRNSYSCSVELASGKTLTLEESQDVAEKNQGILIFAGKKDPVYIPWEGVSKIILE